MGMRVVLGSELAACGEPEGDEEPGDLADYYTSHMHRSLPILHPMHGRTAQLSF
jgi:hypothetical protein